MHTYDYVVVGGGSAGCVLAARLSEDPDLRVCLVEAGPPDTSENVHVPSAFGKLFRTSLDWDYDTHDEPRCDNRRIYLPRGRVLGGTSSMNAMVYIRGHRADYDEWGQPGWSYAELLPYFLRSEDNERGAGRYHGVGGPLSVSGRPVPQSDDPGLRGRRRLGRVSGQLGLQRRRAGRLRRVPGHPAGRPPVQHGRGFPAPGAAPAQPHPADRSPGAPDHPGRGRGHRAGGRRFGAEITLRAEREVILAAGAYNSPQLLMLSGIGPADLLRALDIPVWLDQPEVGANLQDHPQVNLNFVHDEPVSLLVAGEPGNVREYVLHRRGPLASNGPEVGGFVRTEPGLPAPDVQFHVAPMMFPEGGLGVPTDHALSYGACVLRPRSTGAVRIATDDPTAKPRIVHNYYADPADLDVAVRGLRIGLDIARQGPLARYTGSSISLRSPNRTVTCAPMSGGTRRPCSTRSEPAPWGPLWTVSCACSVWTACGWWMPQSCRPWCVATPTRRSSPSPRRPPT
ncbi:GMC family oxidoreductase N-terminal domain-containing protein [Kutzneria kofuensis]